MLSRLWHDDTGGIISTEYVMVMGIVVTGASAGLVKLRDEGNKQMADLATIPAVAIPDQETVRKQVAMPLTGSASVVQNVTVNVFPTQLPPSP